MRVVREDGLGHIACIEQMVFVRLPRCMLLLLSGVDEPFMAYEEVTAGEGLGADLADEGFLFGVGADVSLKMLLFGGPTPVSVFGRGSRMQGANAAQAVAGSLTSRAKSR